MNCSICHNPTEDGRIINGKPICNGCILNGMVKTVAKKKSQQKNWQIVTILIKHGIRKNQAITWMNNHSPYYLVKKLWYLIYTLDNINLENPSGWLKSAIEEDYIETDKFWEWLKINRYNKYKQYEIMQII